MKNLKIFFILTCLLFTSCKKYVDIIGSSRYSYLVTVEDCQELLDNASVMNSGFPTDGELSADDFYLPNTGYLASDLDLGDRDLYVWKSTAIRPAAKPQWQNGYYTIYNANLVLEALEKLEKNTDRTTLNKLKGSALFYRGFALWQIAQLYCRPYGSSSGTDLGIPIRLTSDINEKSERGTVKATYQQIINDLNEASVLLNESSIVPTRPNKAGAFAMLARVYLSMEEYSDALANATNALLKGNSLLDFNVLDPNSDNPLAPQFNKEVIFHSTANATVFASPFGGNGQVDPTLATSYESNDLRGKIFIASDFTGGYRFKGDYSGIEYSDAWFNGLAVDELYLIRAECNARLNKISDAMKDLNTLLVTRWKKGTYVDFVANNTDEALVKILSERRKELLMRNLRWTDLRRLNKDSRFAKTLTRSVPINNVNTTFTLPPNDARYTLLIPNEVIQNGGIPQNQR